MRAGKLFDIVKGHHKEVALASGDGGAVTRLAWSFAADVHVTKVAAFDVGDEADVFDPVCCFFFVFFRLFFLIIKRKVLLLFFLQKELDVDVQLEFALLNEIQLVRVILLLIEHVTL